jgi:hypothetical protein
MTPVKAVPLADRSAMNGRSNPLLVRLVAEHTAGPQQVPTLEEAILSRVDDLSAEQRTMVQLLAVASFPLDTRLLAEAAGSVRIMQVLRELQSERFICIMRAGNERRVDLYHDKIRETVLANLGADQRYSYRQRLAAVLEAHGGDPAILGELFAGLGDRQKAGNCFFQAAQAAHERLAFPRASELYRAALDLAAAGEKENSWRRALAESLSQAGNAFDAAHEYVRAADGAPDSDRFELLSLGARCLLTSGHVEAGTKALQKVLAECRISYPHSPVTSIASFLCRRAWLRFRGLHCESQRDEIPDNNQRRIQAYWSAVAGLSVIDPLRAADRSP